MGAYARLDKFGVVEANHLLTGGYNRTSTPGDKEVRIFLESGDYVLKIYDSATSSWKYVEKTRSQERVYHGQAILDDNSPALIPFYVPSTATTVKLKLWGVAFPGFPYTELPAHNHGGTTFASSSHYHTGPNHRHGVSITTGAGTSHKHSLSITSVDNNRTHTHTPGGGAGTSAGASVTHTHVVSGDTNNESTHTHSLSGNSDYGGTGNTGTPSATAAIPSAGISGGLSLNDTAKTSMDDLIQLYITAVQGTWGTAKTKATTTPVDFSSLANINANGGTNEIDIYALISTGSFNYLRVVEPTAKKGGTLLWHFSIS